MKRTRRIGSGDAMLHSVQSGDLGLEPRDCRPLRQKRCAESLDDGRYVRLADVLATVGNAGRHIDQKPGSMCSRISDLISSTERKCSFVPLS